MIGLYIIKSQIGIIIYITIQNSVNRNYYKMLYVYAITACPGDTVTMTTWSESSYDNNIDRIGND